MKKILMLYSTKRHEDSGQLLPSLKQSVEGLAMVLLSSFDDLIIKISNEVFSIVDTKNKLELKEFDMIILRGARFYEEVADVGTTLAYYCRANHVQLCNEIETAWRSKLGQMVRFAHLGAPIPDTLYLNEAVLADEKVVAEQLGYPCIMKATIASGGDFNYKINNFGEIAEHQAANPNIHFVLQNFIPNAGDYRLFMAGSEKAVIHRQASSPDVHVNNADKGGKTKVCPLTDLPEGAVENAERIAEYFHLPVCGADIIINKETGAYSFLEVNAFPGIDVDEEVPAFRQFLAKSLKI